MHLVDSQYCSDAGKFLSVVLTSLSTMVMLETPHVNVLSKIDLIKTYTPLGQYIVYPLLDIPLYMSLLHIPLYMSHYYTYPSMCHVLFRSIWLGLLY